MNERSKDLEVLKLSEESSQPTAEIPMQHVIAAGVGEAMLPKVQQRVEVIQELLGYQGSDRYSAMQRIAAKKLGLSVRSVQRLLKAWREQGIIGLSPQPRTDRGSARISQEWQNFIVKTYKDGNRASRSMSLSQVAVRVKVRAQELGVEDYPSHMTVYRILKPFIEQRQQQKRSIGWKGSRLTVKTREGLKIAVEYSNQVWQCDHTKVDVLVVDAVGEILGRPPKQLAKMLPKEPLHLQTRLCAACYAETPVHQAGWQSAKTNRCDRHRLQLLRACPECGTGFRTPALWSDDCCEYCGLPFSQMVTLQQSLNALTSEVHR